IVASVLDPLSTAVIRDLASRYCPVDRSLFLGRFEMLVAALAAIVLVLFAIARLGASNARRTKPAYFGACAIAIFGIGYAALVIFGLSGCGSDSTPGLTWDWPW
ncbi:MAG TPA: hypothetical protein VEW74_07970, partial [Candidatus Nitrosotalea sp.]|nr:hypothetical protein [Candidatus Nitrosotalea sp.]